jgi:serine/threonine protein kinase
MEHLICPSCYQEQPLQTALCANCTSNTLLHNRYRLRRRLGEGGSSQVFLADDLVEQQPRAIKILQLQGTKDWKSIEHFERQLSILRSLSHPGIPKIFEHFEQRFLGKLSLLSVQQWIEGESLADKIKKGHRFREAEAKDLLEKLLEIVGYLHSFSPPVIHRDIKPKNIMIQRDGNPVLIDFDTARGVLIDREKADGTMVGTAGFVPMEQLSGQAAPASDLYALGMTLVVALSHKDIIEFSVERMRIKFEGFVNVSAKFLEILQKMTEPIIEDRYQNVAEVSRALQNTTEAKIKHKSSYIPKKSATLERKRLHKRESRQPTARRAKQGGFAALEATIQKIQAEGPQVEMPGAPPRNPEVGPPNFFDLEAHSRKQSKPIQPRPQAMGLFILLAVALIAIGSYFFWRVNRKKEGSSIGDASATIEYQTTATAQALENVVWASELIDFSSEWGSASYRAKDALGAPNAFPAGRTNSNAWCPKESDEGIEWLSVRFPQGVEASQILVIESSTPGELLRIEDLSKDEAEVIWRRPLVFPMPGEESATRLNLQTTRFMTAIRVVFDSKLVYGWTEIDAIGLVPVMPPTNK